MPDMPIVDDLPELPPQTAPDSIPVTLRAFADSGQAAEIGHAVAECVRAISRYIDVSRLEGIIVAYDYDAALAELDRGFTASSPLRRTAKEHVVGVAMAAPVLRGAIVKAHLLFFAPAVLPLRQPSDSEAFRLALYVVAHECGHIEDLKYRDESFPGVILQRPVPDQDVWFLEPVVAGIWDEYAASRASAGFGEAQTAAYMSVH